MEINNLNKYFRISSAETLKKEDKLEQKCNLILFFTFFSIYYNDIILHYQKYHYCVSTSLGKKNFTSI